MKTEKIDYTRFYRTFLHRDQHNNRNETSVVLPNSYLEKEYLPVLIKSSGLKIMGTTYRFIISSFSNLLHTADSLPHFIHKEFFRKLSLSLYCKWNPLNSVFPKFPQYIQSYVHANSDTKVHIYTVIHIKKYFRN